MSGADEGRRPGGASKGTLFLVAGLIWLAMALTYVVARPGAMTYTSDSSVYFEAARSLAIGEGYVFGQHVRPVMQGFHRADYVLEGAVTIRSNVPAGLLTEVAVSGGRRFRLLRVDAEVERAWRPTVGLPEPTPE